MTLIQSCVSPKTVAITIDDRPSAIGAITNILDTYGVKAKLLINGVIFDATQDANVIKAFKSGYQIAYHSWFHMYKTTSTYTNKVDKVLRNDNYLLNLIGKAPRYFRFPYLDYDNTALQIVNSLDKVALDLNINSLDWKYDNVQG